MRPEPFERLYEQHAQPLFGFLVYRTGDRALAEDLLADAFERALRARRRFDPRKASEKTWLYAIALNCLRDHARRNAAHQRALDRTLVPAGDESGHALERAEHRDDLARALESLSAEEREVIALRYGADLTVPEIAKVKKEKLTTIEGRVYRALRKLREKLDSP
ncbi:MAG TPA: sigma-70 family RNA polymerase sigma factor [Polyangiaceae bacterium]|jgi:RNA polymerase sigma-70 factor (ECF subfamily)